MKLSFAAFYALANAAVATASEMPPFSAVFSMSNESAGNRVIVWSRDLESGELDYEGSVATGGTGGSVISFSITTGAIVFPNSVDPLGSQDSMTVSGRCLFAVNAGSGQVSSLKIFGPRKISLVGAYPTGGFPVSVAATNELVYVLNADGNGSFQGYRLNQDSCSLTPIGEQIELAQTVAPFEPTNPDGPPYGPASPAQIGFTPKGDILVTIKLNGGAPGGMPVPGTFGTMNHYRIGLDGTTSADTLTISKPPRPLSGTFAFDFTSEGVLLLNEVNIVGDFFQGTGLGGVSFWEENDGAYTEIADPISVNQPLTCWLRYNPVNECIYLTSSLSTGAISTVKATGDGQYEVLEEVAAQINGPLDLVFSDDGYHLYVFSSSFITSPVTGGGTPRMYVYKTDHDCGLELVEEETDGYIPVAENVGANGPTGVAIFPNINARSGVQEGGEGMAPPEGLVAALRSGALRLGEKLAQK